MERLIFIGVIVILIGFLLVLIGALSQAKVTEGKTKVAIGGFIGFIPFGFATDRRLLYVLIGLTLAFFIFWILVNLRIR